MLDQVAISVPKLSIGTIDCTLYGDLCKKHSVRGYPTLKYSLDGVFSDYPGGRAEADFILFANKMMRPLLTPVDSLEEAKVFAKTEGTDGVAFVAQGSEAFLEQFEAGARKFRATGSFLKLPVTDEESFVCRLEEGVPSVCLEKQNLMTWIEHHNSATVPQMGAHNFYKLGRAGKPLLIGAVDPRNTESLQVLKEALVNYALNGEYKNKYNFGWIDGKQWAKFLSQFQVGILPQVFVLDVITKQYYQNSDYGIDVEQFVNDVQSGKIEMKTATGGKLETFVLTVMKFFVVYQPYSAIGAVLLLVLFVVWLAKCCCFPNKERRPPYKRVEEESKEAKPTTDEKADDAKDDEPKKEK